MGGLEGAVLVTFPMNVAVYVACDTYFAMLLVEWFLSSGGTWSELKRGFLLIRHIGCFGESLQNMRWCGRGGI